MKGTVEEYKEIDLLQFNNPGFVRSYLSAATNIVMHDNINDYYILENKKLPTLVIWGDKDKTCDYNNINILKEVMPSAILKTIQDSGHIFIYSRPELTSFYIDEFIKQKYNK